MAGRTRLAQPSILATFSSANLSPLRAALAYVAMSLAIVAIVALAIWTATR